MQFKTKDLMVTVMPKAQIDPELAKVCLFHSLICRHPTFYCGNHGSWGPPCGFCSAQYSICVNCSKAPTCGDCSLMISQRCVGGLSCEAGSVCNPTVICRGASGDPFEIRYVEDLVILKAELQETLKGIDAIQKEGLPSRIGSKAQAEELESGLQAALEQVRVAKRGLTRG